MISRSTGTHNLDPLTLQNAVEVAETRFVYPLLGSVLYNSLVTAKNSVCTTDNQAQLQALMDSETGTGPRVIVNIGDVVNGAEFLSADQQNLWYSNLWKYAAEAVYHVSLPQNYVKFTSEGLMKNNPISSSLATEPAISVGASLKDLMFLMDNSMQAKLDPLRNALHDFLCANNDKYATYIGPCGCGSDAAIGNKSTSWVNLYDDDDVNCCP